MASDPVREVVDAASRGGAHVLVVAPALSGRLAYWTSDDERARRAAAERLARCLAALRDARIEAEGLVGDADPLLAIDDALRIFPADEIVVATHPEHRSNWLAHRIVERARRRYLQPIHHVVVEAGTRAAVAGLRARA